MSTDPQERAHVLVVEDVPLVADMLVEILELLGHATDTAADGHEALQRIESVAYDLVISDIAMPRLDGLGLYRALDGRHATLRSRLIVITGSIPDSAAEQVLRAAGVPIIRKPFSLLDLQRAVDTALTVQPLELRP